MIDKLLDPLLNGLESGNWGVVFVVVAVALIVNLRPILDFLERRESRREDFVREAIKIDAVAGAVRSFLEEELNYLLFKKVTGIPANKALRDKLKEIVDRSAGEIQTFQLARAKNHLRMKEGKLNVVIELIDRVEWCFNWVAAIAMTLFALVFFMLPNAIRGINFQQLVALMGMGFLFFLFALFLVRQTIPLSVARKLQPIIKELEYSSNRVDNAPKA
ncbi:hypothetical protein D3C71_1247820 [compost metagenome]|jgi:hypothetical protein